MLRFSRKMCTRPFSRHFFAPFVYSVTFTNLLLLSDFFPDLSVLCHLNRSQTLFIFIFCLIIIVYVRAQEAILRLSGHSVIQSKKSLIFFFFKRSRKGSASTRQPRSGRPPVLISCVRKSIKLKQSTNKTVQQGRLPRIFNRKILN